MAYWEIICIVQCDAVRRLSGSNEPGWPSDLIRCAHAFIKNPSPFRAN